MSLRLVFDGVDVSDQILAPVTVTREERAAGQASFVWAPDVTQPPAEVDLFEDNFDGVDGTLLENRSPDLGPDWIRVIGQAFIADADATTPQGAHFAEATTTYYRVPAHGDGVSSNTYRVVATFFLIDVRSSIFKVVLDAITIGFEQESSLRFGDFGNGDAEIASIPVVFSGYDVTVTLDLTVTDHASVAWRVLEGDLATGVEIATGTQSIAGFATPDSNIWMNSFGTNAAIYIRLADLAGTSRILSTPILPYELIRKPVQIFWNGTQIYDGFVNDAVWDLDRRVYNIDCSDLFQEIFEGLTPAEITGLIPGGRWSEALFGLEEDGWNVAQDVMSTVPVDVHKDRAGALRTIDWEAKSVADFSYGEGQVLNGGAYALDLAKARDIVTRYKIDLRFSYSRWKMRTHRFSWTYTRGTGFTSFCDWLTGVGDGRFPLPSKELVIQASGGTGWPVYHDDDLFIVTPPNVPGIYFDELPEGGDFCGGPLWAIDETTRQLFCTAAIWTGYRLFAQTVEEAYTLQFDVPGAQASYGVVEQTREVIRQLETDDSAFESGQPPRVSQGGWQEDVIGDWIQDKFEEVARSNDLEAVYGLARTSLREALRGNEVGFEVLIAPTVDLRHTVELVTRDIETKGKVRAIEHRIDLEQAVTRITLAVSTGGGDSDGDLTIPPRPDSSPTHPAPEGVSLLPTHVGGCEDDDPFDPEWEGWITNEDVCAQPAIDPEKIYPFRFRVVGPDIEDEARDDVEAASTTVVTIGVPQDTLVLY